MTNKGLAARSLVTAGNIRAARCSDSSSLPEARTGVPRADLDDHEPKEHAMGSNSNRTVTLARLADAGNEIFRSYCTPDAAATGAGSVQSLTAAPGRSELATDHPRQLSLSAFSDPLDEHRQTHNRKFIVPEVLDLSNAPSFLRALCQAIDQAPDGIEVDMSSADFVGVAGWRVLLHSARYAAGQVPFTFSGLSARHRRIAELLGLTEVVRRLERRDRP
ncbi:MAG: STAS domain-containing protein [Actinomycetota bacterium]|nr:STAS domain-containing protein [Actinomycetota bacterium]